MAYPSELCKVQGICCLLLSTVDLIYHTYEFGHFLEFLIREGDLIGLFGVLETECKGGERALKEVTKKMNRL